MTHPDASNRNDTLRHSIAKHDHDRRLMPSIEAYVFRKGTGGLFWLLLLPEAGLCRQESARAFPERYISPPAKKFPTSEENHTASKALGSQHMSHHGTHYRTANAGDHKIFYRESGDPAHPNLLLLHGFPTSSHMFRDLIPLLADRFHIVAPDLPGFGFTVSPDRAHFRYTFDNLAKVIEAFTDAIGLNRYAIYVFDYGAPTGFRLAMSRPERVTAIISQNGNAYEEGLSTGWAPIQKYWREPTATNREGIRMMLTRETTKWQYLHGVSDQTLVAPESYELDLALLARPGNDEIQLDLFLDYANNISLYPRFHEYFAAKRPPFLAVWGKNDPFFLPAGAEAYRRDIPNAEIRFLDAGHFALETHAHEIAEAIRAFLSKTPTASATAG
jgi:pimeloyl-ACP methyl ester carboxylesterase